MATNIPGPCGFAPFTFHNILEIKLNTPQHEIRSAYKKMALKYHPDKNLNDPYAEDKFKLVNLAYTTLNNPNKRYIYESECRRWKNNGPTNLGKPQSKLTLDPLTKLIYDTIPAMFFSKVESGFWTGLSVSALTGLGLVMYDIYTSPFLVTFFGIYPSLYLAPFIVAGVALIGAPLFCKDWKEFVSYLQGVALSSAFLSSYGGLALILGYSIGSNIYNESNLFKQLAYSHNNAIRAFRLGMKSAMVKTYSTLMSTINYTISSTISLSLNSLRYIINSISYPLYYLTNSCSSNNSTPVSNINDDWLLLYEDTENDIVSFNNEENKDELDINDFVLL